MPTRSARFAPAAFAALLAAALLLTAALSAAPLPVSAAEDAAYARITQADTYLYAAPEAGTGLFALPESWFVRVTGEQGDYCAVSYLENVPGSTPVHGYCLRSELTFVDYIPETPFLSYTVQVTFTAGEGQLPAGAIASYSVDAAFYGTFSYGSQTFYYVELNGAFGYVPASACSALNYPENDEFAEALPEPPPAEAEQNGGAVNAVLACVLAAAALGIAYVLFRPAVRRRRKNDPPREDISF